MAVKTLGTNANNSIAKALAFLQGGLAAADIATLNNAIKDDINPAHPIVGGFIGAGGTLFLPNGRTPGGILIRPGDWVGVDTRGWPIVLSADTIANGPWTHS